MSVNITPQMRVEQYPDEFKVNRGRLWCIWCDRLLNHNRKDLMNEHLWSKIHQDNRVANGAQISYDIDSKEACERRRRRRKKAARSIRRKKERDARNSMAAEVYSTDSSSGDNSTDLRKLFEDSDSDSTTSFEGFDSPPSVQQKQSRNRSVSLISTDDDSRKSGRSRKRPARLDDSIDHEEIAKIGKIADQAAFVSSMTRRRKTTEEYSSPSSPDHSPVPSLRIRSMPIKKQISYSARQSDSTSPTSPIRGSLKMKFSRSTDNKASPEYSVKPNLKVSESESGKGIKLKFTWKNKTSGGAKNRGAKTTDEDTDNLSDDGEPAGYKQMLKGIEDTKSAVEGTNNVEEVIEEEIVEMHEEEVVEEEDWIHSAEIVETSKNETEVEQNLIADTKISTPAALKSAKLPVKSAAKPQAKPKKVSKPVAADVKKRKMTGYMLWTKHTRPKVAKQYPGLEFGDVSKKLGDLWKRMPDKEKQMWKFRTEKFENQSQQSQSIFRKSGSRMIETGPKKKPPVKQQMILSSPPVKNPEATMNAELSRFPPPATEPIDSAAYLSLLGESFAKLSAKTKKVESKVVIQGAESILLDSLVCALAPLLSLTRQIPELEGALDQKSLTDTFSNIAHIMPGL